MDKVISTALLIVISMVMAITLFNVAYPAIIEGGDSITRMANRADEQLQSQIEVIHAAGEINADSVWQDTNANGLFDAFIWVKNVGATRIIALDQADVFFGPEGNFSRISHQSQAGGSYPYWTWQVENAAEWTPSATLKISVHYAAPLSSGRYFIKIAIPSGVSDDYLLGL